MQFVLLGPLYWCNLVSTQLLNSLPTVKLFLCVYILTWGWLGLNFCSSVLYFETQQVSRKSSWGVQIRCLKPFLYQTQIRFSESQCPVTVCLLQLSCDAADKMWDNICKDSASTLARALQNLARSRCCCSHFSFRVVAWQCPWCNQSSKEKQQWLPSKSWKASPEPRSCHFSLLQWGQAGCPRWLPQSTSWIGQPC